MTKPLIGIGADVLTEPGRRDRSFVYLTYTEAVRRAGAVPVLLPPQPENAAEVVGRVDGVLLAGGFDCDPSIYGQERHPTVEPMDPRRQENDLALAEAARAHGVPVLGICLGLQMMNIAAGGTLIQDIDSEYETGIRHASEPEHRGRHDVTIEPATHLASVLPAGEYNVNSSHHQAVGQIGQGLRVTAHAPDGLIEGLEDPHHPFYLGVQWHPEDLKGEESAVALFAAFIEAARRHAVAKRRAIELSPVGASVSE